MKNRKLSFALRTLLTSAMIAAMLAVSGGAVFAGASGTGSTRKNSRSTVCKTVTVEGDNVVRNIGIARARDNSMLYFNAFPEKYENNYKSEILENKVAVNVYDAYVDNFINGTGDLAFDVTLDPPIVIENACKLTQSENGNYVVSVDQDSQSYIDAKKQCDVSTAYGSCCFCYDHPEVFWIRDFDYQFSCSPESDGNGGYNAVIRTLNITAKEAYSGAISQKETVKNGINTAVSSISAEGTRYDTLKNIHDYICTHSVYNHQAAQQSAASDAHTIAPLFTGKGTFVCEGYSKSLKVLCDKFNIPCALVIGTGQSEAHMWTYVRMDDNKWYAVDATWDDAGTEISYDYFLKGSNQFEKDHAPSGYVTQDNSVLLIYPAFSIPDYDKNWNEGVSSETTSSETTSSETTSSETTSSETTSSETTSSETTSSETTSSETTSSDTSSEDQPKMVGITLDNANNGFVKTAQIPETAKAKAGNDDVALNKIRIIVTKLDDTKKKALSNGIKKINNSFDPNNSDLAAYDIELVDENGNTVTITEGKVKICLAFPSTLTKNYKNYVYSVYHQKSEGGVERITPVGYNADGVWFENDKFSPYGLVSYEKSNGDPSPGTGETILLTVIAVIMLALATGSIAFVVIRNRRSDDNEEKSETEL